MKRAKSEAASRTLRLMELLQRRVSARERFLSQLPSERDIRFDGVFGNLAELSVIPRPSGGELEASRLVAHRGDDYMHQGLISSMEIDNAKNVTWEIPATNPEFDTPEGSAILQGHLDAVCKSVNPLKNPALNGMELEIVEREGRYIIQSKNQETTAGVDNGLMAMFLMELPRLLNDLQIPHGRLKVVFTTGEESGLDGARAYEGDLQGYNNFINIDSEEERFITNGSAAIGFSEISLDTQRTTPSSDSDVVFRTFSVSGLHGGHSGATIADTAGDHPSRKNAIHLAADMLNRFAPSAQVVSIHADSDLKNAISSEASFTVSLSREDEQVLQRETAKMLTRILEEGEKDTASITLTTTDRPQSILTAESSRNVIGLLSSLPYGVPSKESRYNPDPNGPQVIQNRMHKAANGTFYEESELVAIQTATNLARAVLDENSPLLSVSMMTRSSGENPETDLEGLRGEIEKIAAGFNAKTQQSNAQPAWKAVPNSELSLMAQTVYSAQFPNRTPLKEIVTLGGLEVALFLKRFPHLLGHIISIGPDIFGAHSVSEHSPYDSGERACQFTLEIIRTLAQNGREKQRNRRQIAE